LNAISIMRPRYCDCLHNFL